MPGRRKAWRKTKYPDFPACPFNGRAAYLGAETVGSEKEDKRRRGSRKLPDASKGRTGKYEEGAGSDRCVHPDDGARRDIRCTTHGAGANVDMWGAPP